MFSKQTRFWTAAISVGVAALFCSSTALAHVAVSGPAFAGQSSVLTFGVGHGCSGADTYELEIAIPDGVTSVRAIPNAAFGDVRVVVDDAGLPTSVVFHKDPETVRSADDQYYALAIRVGVPNTPFMQLFFPATQRCRTAEGEDIVVEWSGGAVAHDHAEADEDSDSEADEAEAEEPPAPAIVVMPPRSPGWNKYTAPMDIHELSIFDDAQIVWAGNSAYSANPQTAALIEGEAGVSPIHHISAGAEIWVKY